MHPQAGLQAQMMGGGGAPLQMQYPAQLQGALLPGMAALQPQGIPHHNPHQSHAGAMPPRAVEFNSQPAPVQHGMGQVGGGIAAAPPQQQVQSPAPVPAPPTAAIANPDVQYKAVHVRVKSANDEILPDGAARARKPNSRLGEDFVTQPLPGESGPSPRQIKAEQEKAAALAAKKAAKEEAERVRAEEEKKWNFADGIDATPEQEAMVRILYELFSKKHESYCSPFTNPREAADLGVQPTLFDLRGRVTAGEYTTIANFAVAVRDVFASCYLAFGHPDRSTLSKKCERLDAVFEQQITLLPRALRDAASLAVAPTSIFKAQDGGASGASSKEELANERRSSARRQSQVQVVTTLQLVERRRQAEAQALEQEKARAAREKREKAIADAEEWAGKTVDEAALQELRESYDGASLCHFLAAFAPVMEVPVAFSLIELELGLLHFTAASALVRWCVECLLRHSTFQSGVMRPMHKGPLPPSCTNLSAALASKLFVWGKYLETVLEKEARGEMVAENEQWLHEFQEGWVRSFAPRA